MKIKFRELLQANGLKEIDPNMSISTQNKIRKFQKNEKELPQDTRSNDYTNKVQELAELDAEILKMLYEDFDVEKPAPIPELPAAPPQKKRGNPHLVKGKPNPYRNGTDKKKPKHKEMDVSGAGTAAPVPAQTAPSSAPASASETPAPVSAGKPKKEQKFFDKLFGR